MARYRHWKNTAQGGDVSFVTTTCLDFAHGFARPALRTAMAQILAEVHVFHQAKLFAYVVMPHHVHFLSEMPIDHDVSWFVQRLKSISGRALYPKLDERELEMLRMQTGLNKRTFWKNSFRSFRVCSEPAFWQKVAYIHFNPVRAGYVQEPETYLWSSAALHLQISTEEEFQNGVAEAVLRSVASPRRQ